MHIALLLLFRESRPEVAHSFAMEGSSNMRTCFYRTGYDISLPLPARHMIGGLEGLGPLDRKYFLTVKGSLYLSGHGSEERMSVMRLDSQMEGIVIALECFELHGEHELPDNVHYCNDLKSYGEQFEYDVLMNTTFGLVPSGRSPGTYRLAEVMSVGAIPVFVARDMVRPFRETYDWPSFSFMFSPDEVGPFMIETLRAVPPERLVEMQRKSLEAHQRMFGDDNGYYRIALNVAETMRKRLQYNR